LAASQRLLAIFKRQTPATTQTYRKALYTITAILVLALLIYTDPPIAIKMEAAL